MDPHLQHVSSGHRVLYFLSFLKTETENESKKKKKYKGNENGTADSFCPRQHCDIIAL